MTDGDLEVAVYSPPVDTQVVPSVSSAIANDADAWLLAKHTAPDQKRPFSYEETYAAGKAESLIARLHTTVTNYHKRQEEIKTLPTDQQTKKRRSLESNFRGSLNSVKARAVIDYVGYANEAYFPVDDALFSVEDNRKRGNKQPLDYGAMADAYLAIIARGLIDANLIVKPDARMAQMTADEREIEVGRLVLKFRDAMKALANF